MASPAAVLQILVTANTAQATTALAKTDAQLKKTAVTANTTSSSLGSKLAPAARMAGAAAGGALVYGLYKAVKVGADFEKQMDAVGAVSNASGKQMEKLEKQALSLGQKTKFSALEVAGAQESLVKGGLKLSDVLGGAVPAALSLAAAGEMDLAAAADTTVNAMKLFGIEGKKAMQVADMLATAANTTTADVNDFALALKQGGSVARIAGADLNDTVTVLEALAEAGVKGSDAGTSLKAFFLNIATPSAQAADAMKELGLSIFDAQGNLKSLPALSRNLQKSFGALTREEFLNRAGIIAGSDAVRTLYALYDAGPEKLRQLTNANAEHGTAEEVAREKTDNLAGSMEQLGGAVQTLAIKLSKLSSPAIRASVDWLTDRLTDLNNLDIGDGWGNVISEQEAFLKYMANITDDRLYEIVAEWNASGKTITKHQVNHWLALNKISAEQADRLFGTIDRFSQNSQDAFGLLSAYMRGTVSNGIGSFAKKSAGFLADWSHKGKDAIDRMMKVLDSLRNEFERTGDKVQDSTDKIANAGERMSKSLSRSTGNVIKSFSNMANATGHGLEVMGKNVAKALNAFGVKKSVSFSIETVGNAAKGFQTGGVIVPGQGNGDKISALLEPGEVVWNKKAVAAMGGAAKANQVNSMVPRFAKGGTVGGDVGGLHPTILQFVSQLYQKYGGTVSSGLRPGTLHGTGQAADYVPSNWSGAAAATNRAGSSLLEGIYNGAMGGPTVSWDTGQRVDPGFWGASTWADHNDHIHIAIADGAKVAASAVATEIKRVLLKGPDGPLKDMGQSALDKVRDAANKFISSKMPSMAGTGGEPGAPIKSLPSALEKYNKTYPGALYPSDAWFNLYQMPFNAAAAMAEWAGLPGVTFAQVSKGEGGLRPGSMGDDNGDGQPDGYGWLAITRPFGDSYGVKELGGYEGMLNPISNAIVAGRMYANQGPGAWYGTSHVTGWDQHYSGPLLKQAGGIIQKFAGGGTAKKGKGDKSLHGSVSGGKTDPAWKQYMQAKKLWDRLKETYGEDAQGGHVAILLERIQNAEMLADADGFLSPGELHRQVRLHEKLLKDYETADRMARRGETATRHATRKATDKETQRKLAGLGRNFGSVKTATSGLTGHGGLLLSERLRVQELKGTATTSDNTALVADLQDLLLQAQRRYAVSQSQYNIFAGAPIQGAMAKGGVAMRGGNYLVGERGPEVVSLNGGNRVHPNSGGSVVIEELNVYSDGSVGVKVGGREFEAAVKKVNRKQARSGGRVLPGRAGS